MNARKFVPILILVPFVTANCGDMASPIQAQTAELAQIEAKLDQVLERLDALDAGRAEQFNQIDATLASYDERFTQIETVLADVNAGVSDIAVGLGASIGATAALESSICATTSLDAELGYKAFFALTGEAEGSLGVDAYGNGASGTLTAFSSQRLNANVNPAVALNVQFCGKLTGQTGVNSSISMDPTDPIIALLENLAGSTGTGQLQSVATALNINGANTSTALNSLTNLTPSQLFTSFNGSGGAALASALPMPDGMRTLIQNPRNVLSDAGEVAQSSIDLLCDQQLQVGAFANAMQAGCDLRDELPPPADVIDIISNLDGIGVTLNSMNTQLASMCDAFGTVANQGINFKFNIPSQTVTIVSKKYEVFPGFQYSYNEALFPNFPPPC